MPRYARLFSIFVTARYGQLLTPDIVNHLNLKVQPNMLTYYVGGVIISNDRLF